MLKESRAATSDMPGAAGVILTSGFLTANNIVFHRACSRRHVDGAKTIHSPGSQGLWLWEGWHGGGHHGGTLTVHCTAQDICWTAY